MKFSVIVPFADDEATIGSCLDSVFRAIGELDRVSPGTGAELICSDGGSSEECLRIVREYASMHGGVHLLERDGAEKGPGVARNRALDVATGDYVVFVDADDTMNLDALASFHDLSHDIVTFLPPAAEFDLTRKVERAHAFSPMVGNLLVWNAIYRRATIGDLRFPSLGNYEDIVFTAGVFSKARTLLSGVPAWYNHVNRMGSANNRHTFRRVVDGFKATWQLWWNCRGAHAGVRTRMVLARKLAMHLVLHVAAEAVKAIFA